jgi:leader peptidase (prepilin peptidase)/N-methyltransferase
MTSSLVTVGVAQAGSAGTPALTASIVTRGAVTAFAAITGLVVGSFLNVVVYRVPRGLSVVEPRSFCPHCDTPVRPIDNVPVLSWVALRGRCHHCRGPISIRYPLVELGTAAVFAAVGWGLGPHWAVPGFCVLAATLVALVAVERDGLAPPLSVAVIGTAIAGAFLVAAGAADHRWNHVVGLAVGVGVATILGIVNHRFRARSTDAVPWTAAAPVLLPVGAALGWIGPVYGGEGLATIVVLLLAVGIVRPSHGRGLLGAALAAGAVVATVLAVALGTGVGT